MPKQKSLSQLEAERAACERQLVQLQHKVQQYENRIAYSEKGERRKRTHRLITRGAAVESVAPSREVPGLFPDDAFCLPPASCVFSSDT